MEAEKIIINIDGGSRGNPGPGAYSAVFSSGGKVLVEYAEYLPNTTNNIAEYSGLILALKKAKAFFGKEKIKILNFLVYSDSELLIKQMKGEYKIQDSKMQELFLIAWNLKVDFKNIDFQHIDREQNKRADSLVNETLDANLKKKFLF